VVAPAEGATVRIKGGFLPTKITVERPGQGLIVLQESWIAWLTRAKPASLALILGGLAVYVGVLRRQAAKLRSSRGLHEDPAGTKTPGASDPG
jgi:hypothetical protein